MSPTAIGILLFAIFFIFAILMYTGKLPALIALPLMAAGLYLVGGLFYHQVHFAYPGSNVLVLLREFIDVVIEKGMGFIWKYVVTVVLGAILAELLKESGVSKTIVRWASELGGDNKMVMCLIMTIVTAVLFLAMGGLGAVIMVATIVLPVLLSVGVTPPVAGSVFLMGMSIGGAFNPVNWALYFTVLEAAGIERNVARGQLESFILPFAAVFIVLTIIFIVLNTRRGPSSFWAFPGKDAVGEKTAGGLALLSPVIPIMLIIGFKIGGWIKSIEHFHMEGIRPIFEYQAGYVPYAFPLNTALLIGVLYCLFATGRGPNGYAQRLTKAIFDGISATAPVAALIVGIGMTISVVWSPAVKEYIEPILRSVIPSSPVTYVIVFTVLAPLALYRGPLNVWGMGIAVGSIMIGTGVLPPFAIMGALYSVGMIQGVSDPTNTHNAWIAGFLGEDVNVFTRTTLPWTWLLALIGLIISAVKFF